ncbi:MAG: hypothetical protein ACJAXK_003424 [Yoonia sp.]|jgi:hypothetical protein
MRSGHFYLVPTILVIATRDVKPARRDLRQVLIFGHYVYHKNDGDPTSDGWPFAANPLCDGH